MGLTKVPLKYIMLYESGRQGRIENMLEFGIYPLSLRAGSSFILEVRDNGASEGSVN
jgi:hypothetical protein